MLKNKSWFLDTYDHVPTDLSENAPRENCVGEDLFKNKLDEFNKKEVLKDARRGLSSVNNQE